MRPDRLYVVICLLSQAVIGCGGGRVDGDEECRTSIDCAAGQECSDGRCLAFDGDPDLPGEAERPEESDLEEESDRSDLGDPEPDSDPDSYSDPDPEPDPDPDPPADRCGDRRPIPLLPQGGPVDCSGIDRADGFDLCIAARDHCEGVATYSRGCEALCSAAGLECVAAYTAEGGRCQPSGIKPCGQVGPWDYCWCGPPGSGDSFVPPAGFCDSGNRVVFDPYVWRVVSPFPNNLYTRDDDDSPTCLRPHFPADRVPVGEANFAFMPTTRTALERLDGFGTSARIVFELNTRLANGLLDPRAVSKITPEQTALTSAPVFLIDIDESSPDYGRARPVVVGYHPDLRSAGSLLLLHPTRPLRGGTKYAAVITSRLPTENGACLGPSRWTARLLTGHAFGPGFDRINGEVEPLLRLIDRAGYALRRDQIAGLTIFTTMDPQREMLAIARQVLDETAARPPSIVPGSLTWQRIAKDHLRWEVKGRFETIVYRDQATGVLQRGEDGLPRSLGRRELDFRLLLPDVPGPDEGGEPYRIFAYHHGLGGDMYEGGGVAERLAGGDGGTPRGWATGYLSTIHHGERCNTDPHCVDDCTPCGEGELAAGLGIWHFFGLRAEGAFLDVEQIVNNFRQDYVDWLVFLRLLTRPGGLDLLPAGAPDGVPDIVDDQVGYTCLSLGGVMGGGIIALSPAIEIAFDNVGGGGVMDIILRGLLFGSIVNSLAQAVFLFDPSAPGYELERWFPLLQTIMDPADPVNFAAGMFERPFAELGNRPKPVLFMMVANDTTVPPVANESLGRAAGAPQVGAPYSRVPDMPAGGGFPVRANHPSGVTVGYNQFSHNCQWDGSNDGLFLHGDMINKPVSVRQWRRFFESFYESGTAEIVDPYSPPLDCR